MAKEQIDFQKSNKYLYITGAVIAIIVIGLITNGFGLLDKLPNGQTTNHQNIPLEIGNSPALGDQNAPLTIYEFSDFSCPYCSAAAGYNPEVAQQFLQKNPSWEPAVPNIIKEYVNSGKVKLVFKYFPGHGTGKSAHQVALALNEQNLFWKFHDKAFANQNDVASLTKMKDLAKSLGADMNKLDADLSKNNYYNAQLDEDYAMGLSQKVSGTPTFIINGRLIEGAQPFSSFKSIIDAELK